MRGFISFEKLVLFLILMALIVGFLPGFIGVNNGALSGIDASNPAYLAIALVPLAFFLAPFLTLFNGSSE